MARFISRRLLLVARHAVAARHDRVHHRQRPARPTSGGRSSARSRRRRRVDALNERLGTNRPAPRPLRRIDRWASSPSTSATRSCPASRSCPSSSAPSVARPSWPASPCSSRSRSASSPGCMPPDGATARVDRGDRPARRDLVVDPRVHHRHDPRRRRRRPARPAAGPRDPAARRGHPDPDPLPAHAGAGDGHRLLRLHRADDARRDDRGPPVRLHADGDDEGPDDEPDDAPPRPAQRPRPDGRGHRGPDRLPVRRDHRGREDLQLQRDGRRRCCSPPSARTSRC